MQQTETIEKVAGIGAVSLWAALHGWLGWLAILYAVCMMLDCVTGTALAIKNKVWSSRKARQGLWHKGGCLIMICVGVLLDVMIGLLVDHVPGLELPFSYDMLITPVLLTWYITAELGSILENATAMGAPVPAALKNILEIVHKAAEEDGISQKK
ncbi:phage holin family protein [uncultured Subdoligranulum sp.]|uniref:phage holin family protein n=1 Tax=uncultured Subdoligranulum sp. TaxID=512298 RepID=UPI00262A15C9|nr:phage holin family protein [uncultured Subdoligranulum sp.]